MPVPDPFLDEVIGVSSPDSPWSELVGPGAVINPLSCPIDFSLERSLLLRFTDAI